MKCATSIVIEAASEKLEIKKQIFADLAAKTPAKAILATNTSALPIEELARHGSPERVVGLHFFNPVSRMKLIEVVVGKADRRKHASARSRSRGRSESCRWWCTTAPGFWSTACSSLTCSTRRRSFEKGVSAEEIDQALLQWGMPMGPLRLIDEIGVDITVDIADTLEKATARDRAPKVLRKMHERKCSGENRAAVSTNTKASSRREQRPTGAFGHLAANAASPARYSLRKIAIHRNRLIFLMVNEAARCLEEKVVATPEDADYGMILGTGFPTFRGGPLRYAERWPEKGRDGDGWTPFSCRREIYAVRFAASARPGRNYIL